MIMGHMYIHIEDGQNIVSSYPHTPHILNIAIVKPSLQSTNPKSREGTAAAAGSHRNHHYLKMVLMIGQLDLLFAFKGHVS